MPTDTALKGKLEALIMLKRRELDMAEGKAAFYGNHVPVDIQTEIEQIRQVYGSAADQIIAEHAPFLQMSQDTFNTVRQQVAAQWPRIQEIAATVRKENLVRLDHLPLMQRVPSLPELPPGTRVRLSVEAKDYLTLDLSLRYQETLDVTPAGAAEADAEETTEN